MLKRTGTHTVLWVPRFWPAVGGTEFHSHELAQHLAEQQRVTVVTHCTTTENPQDPLTRLAAEALCDDRRDRNFRTKTIATEATLQKPLALLGERYGRSVFARRAYQLLFDQAFRNEAFALVADADRIHCIYNGLTESAWLACSVAAHHGIPFVFTPNVLDTSDEGSAWASKSFLNLYHRAECLIALTAHEAAWLVARGVDADKISVVPYGPILTPGIGLEKSESTGLLLQQRFILFLGRLVPEKAYETLLHAFRLMSESDPDTRLVLVGHAEGHVCNLIHEFNRQLGEERVYLLQDASQPLKTALLEQAVLLCVPSTRESLGGVYIEAMACGTPVVALDRPVSRCVIDHGQDGLLVHNTPEALAAAFKALIDAPALARSMGLAGKAKVARRYAWSVVTDGVLRVYERADDRLDCAGCDAA